MTASAPLPAPPHAPAPSGRGARLSRFLSRDTTGGILLLVATVLALVIANSPAVDLYDRVRAFTFGPEALHLDLSVGAWAADGLLAIFFFVVGLELKQEFVAGSLRDPRVAALPIAAAVGGVIVPAGIFTLINRDAGAEALQGWAIPAATDIAFAVAVIAVVGRRLPPALRTFLLTLAVVDDLLAITIIAVFYTASIAFVPLLLALVPLAAFGFLVQRGVRAWYLLIPLGFAAWALVHASGIHATIAGVALGLLVPAIASARAGVTHRDASGHEERHPLTHHFAERWSPVSAGVAVPVFAFFSAGVAVGGFEGLAASLSDSVASGIIVALVVGKAVGITGAALLVTRLPGIRLDPSLKWIDVLGLSFVAGIGFTVSLLVGELAYGSGSPQDDVVKVGVLVGSLIAAIVGGTILGIRDRQAARPADQTVRSSPASESSAPGTSR
ncbi:Na+/H+ antiporter NhaA [Clavibacter lycopersici]|uniref:Na(+)/H(+) antiporter NhaA n=1 Tax=Clavibacter lycopersici TaxID=2301718 RepID=A0A399T5R1_9MICO|nr:Na+/H+ antiporter NhaA [Clavibacter lycopersici]RIJ51700.1 Na+/H+ antiporter NhaA [Clavibacter lycopersici]RIJ61761.1 Na+/H+ antiporter NhaA [Clavibacter lycopersici]